jgi:hypothetical protein
LWAAIKSPNLFHQSPATIAANIEAVVGHFRERGLTLPDYLRAAIKQAPLFYQSPATIIANIEGVANHFSAEGLTLPDYLHGAVRQPSLFYQSPTTLIVNIEGVANHFAAEGLTLPDYLRAAVKQPQLFNQSPATIIGHVNLIIDLHRQGLVTFPSRMPLGQPLRPLFDFLINNPSFFVLADDNFVLREVAVRTTGQGYAGTTLLKHPRHRIESDLAEHLGHPDLRVPVPKEPLPEHGGDPDRHTRNVLLRALIRAGMVKGGQLER